ncbi:MAG: acyl-ACP--UDP-N-acetylglucosamine O-acyltransferase [bacterium]
MSTIDSSSIVLTDNIGKNVYIGPNCKISKNVKIMDNVFIECNTTIDEGTVIYPFVVIGTPPQDKSFKNEESFVIIGKNNIIREFTTIHRPTGLNAKTVIGDNNYFMAYSHIAHNCYVGNNTVISSYAAIAGYSFIDDYVILGGMAGVHQKVRIGKYTIVGGMSKVVKDIPPFMMVDGNPGKVVGINKEGMKRNGFSFKQIDIAKKIYQIIYKKGFTIRRIKQELEAIKEQFINDNRSDELFVLNIVLDFINLKSDRGLLLR